MSVGSIIVRGTIVIFLWNLLARFLAFGREAVIAFQFGAEEATDAYVVALTIPSLIFAILTSALITVVISVFNEYAAQGRKDESWRIFSSVFNILMLLFVAVTVLGILGAPLLVKMVAPGFKESAYSLTVELTRIMLPYVVFSGLATLFTGLLNANNIFGIPAFSGSVINATIIVSALTLGAIWGIHGLAVGTVLGMVGAVLVQIPTLLKAGFRLKLYIDYRHPGVKKVFYLILPIMIGVSLNQFNILVDRILASGLAEGSIASLNYALKLMNLPLGLFVLAISTASFPTMTTQAAKGEQSGLVATILRTLKLVLLISIPSSVGLMVLRFPIIRLLFERGVFDERATQMTAIALMFYSLGLAAQAVNIILTRGFYAMQDTRTPVKLTVIAVVVNLIFSLILIRPMAHGGLALANSLAAILNSGMLALLLGRELKELKDRTLLNFMFKVLAASVIMGAAAYKANALFAGWFASQGTLGLALQVGFAITVGLMVYVAACFAFKVDEAYRLWDTVREFAARRAWLVPGKLR